MGNVIFDIYFIRLIYDNVKVILEQIVYNMIYVLFFYRQQCRNIYVIENYQKDCNFLYVEW